MRFFKSKNQFTENINDFRVMFINQYCTVREETLNQIIKKHPNNEYHKGELSELKAIMEILKIEFAND